jgi:NADH-quinone oxidoreductase subunit G
MATLYIDNVPYETEEGQDLLTACLSLGFDIPYLCWHPALHSVGACRLCAVKLFRDENDTRGHIFMSCMTAVKNGLRLSVDDPEVREFRASVMELLMINHPHDCPVCDEGGECHLQDMTLMTGHNYRRYRFTKRTYRNQHLGPFINHEMNRCIQCYRCLRFYRDYAGGRDFNVFGSHDHVYFGRHDDGALENEFSGNLAEVCPTGVFTDATLKKHYARKWDIRSAPSICVHCGLGCNTLCGERYGTLRSIRNRYNGDLNGYFLCDRGRFGYEFVESNYRIRSPLRKSNGAQIPCSPDEALAYLKERLHFGSRVIGIGSSRASLEANYALKTLVGHENFFAGICGAEHCVAREITGALDKSHVRLATMAETENADAIFVLGEDVPNTAPRLALALRQATRQNSIHEAAQNGIPYWNDKAVRVFSQNETGPLFIASIVSTRLDDAAMGTFHGPPPDLARLGFAVAHEIDPDAPTAEGLPEDERAMAKTIASALLAAERPLVVSGFGAASEEIIQAALNVALALKKIEHNSALFLTTPECNTMGLALLADKGLDEAEEALKEAAADVIVVLENDLHRRLGKNRAEAILSACDCLTVIDHNDTPTTRRADFVLPAGTFAESDGTFVNCEGRAQRAFKVIPPGQDVREGWRWIRDIMDISHHELAGAWHNLDDVIQSLSEEQPVFALVREAAPSAHFRVSGLRIPREAHRASGRTSIHAHEDVNEPRTPEDHDSPLSFSMEGYLGIPPSPLIPRFWAPGWNSPQALDKYQVRVGGELEGGNPGTRIMRPAHGGRMVFSHNVPDAVKAEPGRWLVVPLYHIFGGEELSTLAPAIAERAEKPYIAVSPKDAETLEMDGEVSLSVEDMSLRLPVRVMEEIPPGVVGIPVGLKGLEGVHPPLWAELGRP